MERILIGAECEILIGDGLARGEVLAPRRGRERAAVLTQPGAARWARGIARRLRDAGIKAPVRVLPDGDGAKTLAVAAEIYEWLAAEGLHRSDTVIGVGGGAVTDLAGFVAATYLRGVEAVYLPTTLLGAVDAAIGGKTGVNLGGKNLVGVFRHPARVVVDTAILAGLPDDIWAEGAAEALKAGLIGDPDLVDLFERDGRAAPLGDVVPRAIAVKARVVAADFAESGVRAVLNYGHTIGHAIEVTGGMSHGHAVAVGMVAAGAASARVCGFADAARQRHILESLGLPVTAGPLDLDEVRRLLAMDKKRDAAGLRMVLLEAVGKPTITHVDSATVDVALAAVANG